MKKLFILLAIFILVSGLCFAQIEAAPPAGGGAAGANGGANGGAPALPKPELFDLEISVGYPVHWTNAEHDKEFYTFYHQVYTQLDKPVTANTSIGIALLWNFSRKVGFTIDYDFFYSTRMQGFSAAMSDSVSLFGMNALVGPTFFIYNGTFLRVPLAIGAHVYYYSDELWQPYLNPARQPSDPDTGQPVPLVVDGFWMQRRDFQVGPGVSLGAQFHFNNNIYFFMKTSVAIDIYRWHQIRWIQDVALIADPITGVPEPIDDFPNYNFYDNETKDEWEFVISWNVKPVIGLGIKF
jgi:hypothetical protein